MADVSFSSSSSSSYSEFHQHVSGRKPFMAPYVDEITERDCRLKCRTCQAVIQCSTTGNRLCVGCSLNFPKLDHVVVPGGEEVAVQGTARLTTAAGHSDATVGGSTCVKDLHSGQWMSLAMKNKEEEEHEVEKKNADDAEPMNSGMGPPEASAVGDDLWGMQ